MTTIGIGVIVGFAFALFVLVAAIQLGRVPRILLLSLAVVCGFTLLAMLITDWPLGVLSDFWAEHSVLAPPEVRCSLSVSGFSPSKQMTPGYSLIWTTA